MPSWGLQGVVRIAPARIGCIARSFYSARCKDILSFTSLIGYLHRQMTFVTDLKPKCSRLVTTRWLSLGKASAWLVRNVIAVHAHTNERQPACAPFSAWWATLYRVMDDVTPVFVALQGFTTLVPDQESKLEALRNSLRETIGATRVTLSDMSKYLLQVKPYSLPSVVWETTL
jgi:hypothetical protein